MPVSENDRAVVDEPRKTSLLAFIFKDRLPLEMETSWFILMNVLDFFMTYLLLKRGGFRESNPIANWFAEGWGPVTGLLSYKLAMVAFVCVIAQIIAVKQVRTAQRLLWVGTAIVGGVVLYSTWLYVR